MSRRYYNLHQYLYFFEDLKYYRHSYPGVMKNDFGKFNARNKMNSYLLIGFIELFWISKMVGNFKDR
jgi:hypothetical protein